MFCPKCGEKIVNESNTFCTSCGSSLAGAGKEIPEKPAGTKRSALKKPVLAVILVVALCLVGLGVYAAVDSMKPAKVKYMLVEKAGLASLLNEPKAKYAELYEKWVKPFESASYQDKLEINFNGDFSDSGSGYFPVNILKDIELTLDSTVNPAKKQSRSDVSLSMAGNKLIDGIVLRDDKKIGISVPDIYEKYFFVDTSDLEALYEKLGMDASTAPKKLFESEELKKLIDIKPEDLQKIGATYGKLYNDSITDKQVSYQKNATYAIDSASIKCDKYTVSFDEDQFKNLLLSFFDTVIEDETLFDMFYDNYMNVISTIYSEELIEYMGLDIDKSEIMDELSYAREGFEEALDYVELPDGVTMTVWVRNDGFLFNKTQTIIGREIEAVLEGNGTKVDVNFDFGNIEKDGNKDFKLAFNVKSKYEGESNGGLKISLNSHSKLDKADNSENGTIELLFDFNEYGDYHDILTADVDFKTTRENADNVKRSYDFNVTAKDQDGYEAFTAAGALELNDWYEKKDKTLGQEFKLSLNRIADLQGSMTLGVKSTRTPGVKFEYPEISESDIVDLNNIDEDELEELGYELQEALQEFGMVNSELFQSLMGYGMY